MVKGFHTLASGMLTHSKNLNVISNNMANSATPGFKKDTLLSTTFKEQVLYRTGNKNKSNPAELGRVSMIRTVSDTPSRFTEGPIEETGRALDFAIHGDGFFGIQVAEENEEGEAIGEPTTLYTRNGSFNVDEEGYLCLSHVGRVMGTEGPLYLGTDHIFVDNGGNIFDADTQALLGTISTTSFTDQTLLAKTAEGMFENAEEGNIAPESTSQIKWQCLERSNVEVMEEMTSMMTSQRAIQSASQVIKIYDQLLQKTVSEIGRI